MARKNNNNLFFTCSLIEYMGRKVKRTRREVVEFLGKQSYDFFIHFILQLTTSFLSLILCGKQIIALLLNASLFSSFPPITIFTRPGFFFTVFSPRHCCIWFHDQVLISSPVHPHVPPYKKAFTDSLRFP